MFSCSGMNAYKLTSSAQVVQYFRDYSQVRRDFSPFGEVDSNNVVGDKQVMINVPNLNGVINQLKQADSDSKQVARVLSDLKSMATSVKVPSKMSLMAVITITQPGNKADFQGPQIRDLNLGMTTNGNISHVTFRDDNNGLSIYNESCQQTKGSSSDDLNIKCKTTTEPYVAGNGEWVCFDPTETPYATSPKVALNGAVSFEFALIGQSFFDMNNEYQAFAKAVESAFFDRREL